MNTASIEDKRDRALELVSGLPGAIVGEGEAPKIVLPVYEALEEQIAEASGKGLEDFLNAVTLLTLVKGGKDSVDRVIGFSEVARNRLTAVVYHHFQGWFNSNALTEEVAKDCVIALAIPYDQNKQAEEDFSFWQHDDFASGRARGLQINQRRWAFNIEKYYTRLGSTRKSAGYADWKSLEIESYGDATLSSDSEVLYDKENKKLYRMYSYRIERPRQCLSLLLSLGSLAHHASQDLTEYEVFNGVTWSTGIRWPFDIAEAQI